MILIKLLVRLSFPSEKYSIFRRDISHMPNVGLLSAFRPQKVPHLSSALNLFRLEGALATEQAVSVSLMLVFC